MTNKVDAIRNGDRLTGSWHRLPFENQKATVRDHGVYIGDNLFIGINRSGGFSPNIGVTDVEVKHQEPTLTGSVVYSARDDKTLILMGDHKWWDLKPETWYCGGDLPGHYELVGNVLVDLPTRGK